MLGSGAQETGSPVIVCFRAYQTTEVGIRGCGLGTACVVWTSSAVPRVRHHGRPVSTVSTRRRPLRTLLVRGEEGGGLEKRIHGRKNRQNRPSTDLPIFCIFLTDRLVCAITRPPSRRRKHLESKCKNYQEEKKHTAGTVKVCLRHTSNKECLNI